MGLQLPSPALVGLALPRPCGPGLEEEGWVPGTCQTVSLQDRELGPEELDGEWPLLVAVAGGRCP